MGSVQGEAIVAVRTGSGGEVGALLGELARLAIARERRGDVELLLLEDPVDALWLVAQLSTAGPRRQSTAISAGRALADAGALVGRPVDDCVELLRLAPPGKTLAIGSIGEVDAPGVSRREVALEGRDAAVWMRSVYELEWTTAGAEAQPELPRLLAGVERDGGFFGRGADLGALERSWGHAIVDGNRQLALVSGEPGVGKTRLLARLGARLAAGGATVLYGRCQPGSDVSFEPIVEALSAAGERPRWADPSGEATELEIRAAAARQLAELSHEKPLLLLIDDLHWADRATAQLLQHLLDGDEDIRGMAVVAFRETEVEEGSPIEPALGVLRMRPGAIDRRLEGLESSEVAEMAKAILGAGSGADRAGLVEAVHAESGGNPLFARELIRTLAESGRLAKGDEAFSPISVALPASVTETIRQRVERLDADAVETMSLAAVYGPEFELDVLAGALGYEPARFEAAIRVAEGAGLVVERGEGIAGFSHAMVGRALAERSGAAQRARISRQIGEAMEAGDDSQRSARVEALARHWLAASPPDRDRAIRYSEEAGIRALAGFRSQAAMELLGAALELHGEVEDERRCALLLAFGQAQRHNGDAAFRDTLLESARLARRLGNHQLLAESVLANHRGMFAVSGEVDPERIAMLEVAAEVLDDEAPALPLVLATLSSELSFSGDDRRFALSDRALERARHHGDERALAAVLISRFHVIWIPDTLEERLANGAEGVEVADRVGDPILQFGAVHSYSVALFQLGDIERATAMVEREIELAKRFGDPMSVWITFWDRTVLAVIHGRLDEADALANEGFQYGTRMAQPDALTIFGSQIASVRWEQGRLAELQAMIAQIAAATPGVPTFRPGLALACLEGGMLDEARDLIREDFEDGFSRFKPDVAWLSAMNLFAMVSAELEDEEVAAELYERLEPYAGQVVFVGTSSWGDVNHVLAQLSRVLGRHEEALSFIEGSLAGYERIAAPVWLARAHFDAARIRLDRNQGGDRDEALAHLELAVEGAESHGSASLHRRAAALRENVFARESLETRARRDRRPAGPQPSLLSFEGDTWLIAHGGHETRIKDSIGVLYLSELLANPGVEQHALDLQAGGHAGGPAAAPEGTATGGAVDGGPVLDQAAKDAYRGRIEDLRAEIEEAERFNDPERSAGAHIELEALAGELAAATGLSGRDRRLSSEAERARLNVTRAVRRTIARMAVEDPRLGAELDRSIRTGTFCSFEPAAGEAWVVRGRR